MSGPNGDAPGTICDECDRAIHYSCHESHRKPKFIKCKKCKTEKNGGRKAKVAAKLASKRQSDPDIETSNRSRDRHGSESGSSSGTGERDRMGLNDSLRYVSSSAEVTWNREFFP